MSEASKTSDQISLTEKEWDGLETLSSAQLRLLIDQAKSAYEVVHAREMKEAMEEMIAVAEARGFNIKEMMGQADFAKLMATQVPVLQPSSGEPVRFRDDKNPSLTWTGRGRLPRWLKEIKEAGGDVEDYRIAP